MSDIDAAPIVVPASPTGDQIAATMRAVALVIGVVSALAGFVSTRNLAGFIAYMQSSQFVAAVGIAMSAGAYGWSQWKIRHRSQQLTAIAGDARVPDTVAKVAEFTAFFQHIKAARTAPWRCVSPMPARSLEEQMTINTEKLTAVVDSIVTTANLLVAQGSVGTDPTSAVNSAVATAEAAAQAVVDDTAAKLAPVGDMLAKLVLPAVQPSPASGDAPATGTAHVAGTDANGNQVG